MANKLIAVTGCPVGVAHTYMAAESLERAGEEMGIQLKVETHGSIGIENQVSEKEIEEADGIIIASDKDIDKSRFIGKRIIEVPVRKGIDHPKELIQRMLDGEGKVYGNIQQVTETKSENSNKSGNIVYRALMNGVSYMVPFVVTGGLLIALALSLGGIPTEAGFVIPEDSFWNDINAIGGAAMGFMIPILAGYISYAIADRPGLVPGMVGGVIAANGSFYGSEANTGFIGGIIAGFLAGYVAKWIKQIPVPKAINSIMPIIIIPVISSVIVGLLFIYLIGQPVAGLFSSLTNFLAGMQGANSIILATLIGAMIAVDMGGPFNKTAFLFGSGLIAEGVYNVMGAVAVAVCIPPIAVGLASHIYKNKFTDADRQAGTAAVVMGFFGITEGAIPFAAKNPTRIIPAIIGGSAVGSIIGMIFGVGGHVAHGGPIVAILGAIDNVLMYFVAVAVGVVVSILLVGLLVDNINKEQLQVEAVVNEDNKLTNKDKFTFEKDSRLAKKDNLKISTDDSSNEETSDIPEVALTDLMNEDLVVMDMIANNKTEAFKELLAIPALSKRVNNRDILLEAVIEREEQGSTGMGEGIAIPHAKSDQVIQPTVVFGKSASGVEWESLDGEPVNIAFLILVPERHKGDMHLRILQILARKLMDPEFKQSLLKATTKEKVYQILREVK